MIVNKIFYGTHEEIKGVERAIWILLKDAKVCTQVGFEEALRERMLGGCFVQVLDFPTREEARQAAIKDANSIHATFVYPGEFRRIEKERQTERISEAFAIAEEAIRNG